MFTTDTNLIERQKYRERINKIVLIRSSNAKVRTCQAHSIRLPTEIKNPLCLVTDIESPSIQKVYKYGLPSWFRVERSLN